MNKARISKCSSSKKGNLLPPCCPRTVWAMGEVAPAAPVAPAPLELWLRCRRIQKDVNENFHSSICYNVLKESRMCRNNEHIFCLACISEHLKVNSQTCPECNEHLSIDTLRRPRVLNNILSIKLKLY